MSSRKAISTTALRRRLPPGKEFMAQLQFGPMAGQWLRRKVVKQSGWKMASTILDGPKAGGEIDLQWKHTKAEDCENGEIMLSIAESPQNEIDGEVFLIIRIENKGA